MAEIELRLRGGLTPEVFRSKLESALEQSKSEFFPESLFRPMVLSMRRAYTSRRFFGNVVLPIDKNARVFNSVSQVSNNWTWFCLKRHRLDLDEVWIYGQIVACNALLTIAGELPYAQFFLMWTRELTKPENFESSDWARIRVVRMLQSHPELLTSPFPWSRNLVDDAMSRWIPSSDKEYYAMIDEVIENMNDHWKLPAVSLDG